MKGPEMTNFNNSSKPYGLIYVKLAMKKIYDTQQQTTTSELQVPHLHTEYGRNNNFHF